MQKSIIEILGDDITINSFSVSEGQHSASIKWGLKLPNGCQSIGGTLHTTRDHSTEAEALAAAETYLASETEAIELAISRQYRFCMGCYGYSVS